jgi:hypothetical protein
MAKNPEFTMQGITFVISAPGGARHALPFKLRLPNGKRAEIQHVLNQSFTVFDVIAELRLLANNLELMVTLPEQRLSTSLPVSVEAAEASGLDPKHPQP